MALPESHAFCCQNQYDAWKKDDIWRKDEHSRFNAEEMNKKVLMWERSHRPSMCVAWNSRWNLPNLLQKRCWNFPRSDFSIFLPPSMQVIEFSKTAYQLTSDFLVGPPLTGSWLLWKLPESRELVFYNTKLGTGKQLMGETWTNQIQLVSCKYRVDIMNMALFCLMFTTECHL